MSAHKIRSDKPEELIRSYLSAIVPMTEFKSKDNSAIIRRALEELFPLTCDDTTYNALACVFLNLAYDRAENENKTFRLVRYRTTLTVYFDSSDLFDQEPIFVFHYAFVFERPRVSWHVHWMRYAYLAASRTNCRAGRAVGAQFVHNNVQLISGYNGVPPKFPHPKTCLRVDRNCPTGTGLDLCPCNHAEKNAIGQAANRGIALAGSTLYVTSRPCPGCMGDLAVVRPKRIIYDDLYDGADVVDEIARRANIELIHIKDVTDE